MSHTYSNNGYTSDSQLEQFDMQIVMRADMQAVYTDAHVLCFADVPQRSALQPDLPHLALLCGSDSHGGKQVWRG